MKKYQGTSNIIGGKKKYAVYRIRRPEESDHSGNREYATEYMDDKFCAEAIAKELNRKNEEE